MSTTDHVQLITTDNYKHHYSDNYKYHYSGNCCYYWVGTDYSSTPPQYQQETHDNARSIITRRGALFQSQHQQNRQEHLLAWRTAPDWWWLTSAPPSDPPASAAPLSAAPAENRTPHAARAPGDAAVGGHTPEEHRTNINTKHFTFPSAKWSNRAEGARSARIVTSRFRGFGIS